MSDMRQKLLPVFLEEAGRKILQLNEFLTDIGGDGRSLSDLEAAFRAAHTLKGTAALVQADAVRILSARIEGLLEGHFENARFPSAVEYEAMHLALDRLKVLVAAVEKNQVEPVGVLAEAELALKLAMAFPGRKQLSDLTYVEVQDDLFAEDPTLDQPDLIPAIPHAEVPAIVDPFADDFSFLEEPCVSASVDDPFADDPLLDEATLDVELVSFADVSVSDSLVGSSAQQISPLVVDERNAPHQSIPEGESFVARMRKRIEKESPLETAKRLAETLQRQNEGESVARSFNCCHFRVAGKDYFLPIENMVEIADLPQILRLPLAPPVVRGLINLRGQVLPVIDLSFQSGTAPAFVAVRKLVVAEAGGEKLAFLSDGIPDLAEELCGEKIDVMNFVEQFRAGVS